MIGDRDHGDTWLSRSLKIELRRRFSVPRRVPRSSHVSMCRGTYPSLLLETQSLKASSVMSSIALLATELQVCRIFPGSAAPCSFPSYLTLPSPWLARRGESTQKSARCVVYGRSMYYANGPCHIGRGKVTFSTEVLSRTSNCQSVRYVTLLCVTSGMR